MKKLIPRLIVGNWKMNPQTQAAAKRLAADIKDELGKIGDTKVVLAPPFVFVSAVRDVLGGSKKILLGAQDAHWDKLGAKTGEVSLPMLEDLGVAYVIFGHSERRALGEKDEVINKKVLAALKSDLHAIVCVGEAKRDHGAHYFTFVEKQLREALRGVSKAKLDRLIIAYEPIWAIGTGNNATPADAHEMRIFIQKILADLYTRNFASKVRILYGGSVTARNAQELLEGGTVDGFLVGGSSLRAGEFAGIVKAAL